MPRSAISGRVAITGRIPINQAQNYFTFSEQFDNAIWFKSSLTVTANQITAPDGTLTADMLTDSGAVAKYIQTNDSVNGWDGVRIQCHSVYLKSGTITWAALVPDNGLGSKSVFFDLTNGVIGTVNGTFAGYGMENVGNGWYRCWIAFIPQLNVAARVHMCSADNVLSYVSTSKTMYIWGAQGNYANWASNYTATVGVKNTTAIRNRIPKAQNFLLQSENFSNASWSKTNITITANSVVNPLNGAMTASTMTDTADGGAESHYINQIANGLTVGRRLIFSVYAKNILASVPTLVMTMNGLAVGSYFNLVTGTITNNVGTTATIDSLGSGWYRCTTFLAVNPTTTNDVRIWTGNVNASYVGTGVPIQHIYGAELVESINWAGPYAATTTVAINTGTMRNLISLT